MMDFSKKTLRSKTSWELAKMVMNYSPSRNQGAVHALSILAERNHLEAIEYFGNGETHKEWRKSRSKLKNQNPDGWEKWKESIKAL
jgi:hypothetical protein